MKSKPLSVFQIYKHYFGITRSYIQEYCKHCPNCQLSQIQTTRPPLQPIISNEFLERVQIDLIDMRHMPDKDNFYISHFVDHFTKFHILFPLKSKNSQDVAAMIEERVLAYLGPPRVFHSDNGHEFVNQILHSLFETWGGDTTFVRGRPRQSQSQGCVERGNRVVDERIGTLKKEYGYDSEESDVCPWASWLPMIMYHMNIQYSETTGETPYKMVTGQEPKSPLIPGAPVHVVDD